MEDELLRLPGHVEAHYQFDGESEVGFAIVDTACTHCTRSKVWRIGLDKMQPESLLSRRTNRLKTFWLCTWWNGTE
eukprot:12388438-Karenia_brevis.AAC.1